MRQRGPAYLEMCYAPARSEIGESHPLLPAKVVGDARRFAGAMRSVGKEGDEGGVWIWELGRAPEASAVACVTLSTAPARTGSLHASTPRRCESGLLPRALRKVAPTDRPGAAPRGAARAAYQTKVGADLQLHLWPAQGWVTRCILCRVGHVRKI